MTRQNRRRSAQKTAVLIAQQIVRDIKRDGLERGAALPPEAQMLEKYQVGRGTLREALRYLELQGALSLKPGPGGGPRVDLPDGTSLASTLLLTLEFAGAQFSAVSEARSGIEPLMARLAASRMTETGLAELHQTVVAMEENLLDDQVFLDANHAFHQKIAHSSGNSVYALTIDALIDILDGTHFGVSYPEQNRRPILKAHQAIYTAIADGDGDNSQAAMEAHMAEYVRYITKKFPEALASPVLWEYN